ncbi:hypothetical protein [Vitiosangium sp. GDMCC 1.1324]|uniref:hypothetical protein n=1 Tax=Vitiosangium sp. (strain GDMCC 1.1324) TaxID=2138576 RepID=UPI0011B7CE8C|nr:hypothetical protein [Vitiosangium sp. GDMCC 1.1324]
MEAEALPDGGAPPSVLADAGARPEAVAPSAKPWWASSGFASEEEARAQWVDVVKAQERYLSALPADVKASLRKAAPDFTPLGILDPSATGPEVIKGDFNCDGTVDYALPGLRSQSELARGLTSEPNPSGPRLETLSRELRRFRYDDAAEVRVGLSSRSGLKWQSFPGSQPSNRGPLPADRTLGCTQVTPQDVDVKWAQKHRCDVLYIGCCEKDGSFLLWDQRSRQLDSVGGC